MDNLESQGIDDDVKNTEEIFKNFLSPLEPLAMRIQSLLVWENPRKSAFMFICVHGIFWFLAVFGFNFYFFVSFTTMIIYISHMWKHKIWPEIRVPPPIPEDPDSWTPVHPRLLSVPEICQYLAQIWCSFTRHIKGWLRFRSNHPFLFCVVTSFICIIFAIIGRYIPGIMLSYIIVISIMLWPSVLYHNLLQKCYLKFEPIFMRLDYKLKLKNKWSLKKSKSSKPEGSQGDNGDTVETDSEEEFIPSLDPEATAALARAITDSEDESGTGTPSICTPHLSKEPSVDLNYDEGRQSDVEKEFVEGLGDMPSFDDNLDRSDDELLEYAPIVSGTERITRKKGREMKFVATHFGEESSDSEDETLTRDLNFPDDHDQPRSRKPKSGEDASAGAGLLMSQAFSSVMASALSGISNLAQSTVVSPPRSDEHDGTNTVTYRRNTSGDNVDIGHADVPQGSLQRSDSSDIDIEDEFEFLDDYDDEGEDRNHK